MFALIRDTLSNTKMVYQPALGLLLAVGHAVSAKSACGSNNLKISYPAPVAADGWSYRLVVEGLNKPRGILFDPEDGLLVVEAGSGLVHFSLEDEGGTCVSVGVKTWLLENEDVSRTWCRKLTPPRRDCWAQHPDLQD